jgi:hypothetical protein
MFYSAHPTIYKFIDILKYVQKVTYIKIRSSNQRKKKRREMCEKQNFLRKQMIKSNINNYQQFKVFILQPWNSYLTTSNFLKLVTSNLNSYRTVIRYLLKKENVNFYTY